jgi:hypothetical protein
LIIARNDKYGTVVVEIWESVLEVVESCMVCKRIAQWADASLDQVGSAVGAKPWAVSVHVKSGVIFSTGA